MRPATRPGRVWLALLAPPTIWFLHFGFVYAAASLEMVFEQRAGLLSRLAIGAGTLAALLLIGWIGWDSPRFAPRPEKVRGFWIAVTRLLALVSAIGIAYQAAPALLVP